MRTYFQNLEKDSIEMTKMASTAKNEANALEAENARLETELKNLEVELRNIAPDHGPLEEESANEDEFVPNDTVHTS